jgi:myo-inositol-1-phosphate synthase
MSPTASFITPPSNGINGSGGGYLSSGGNTPVSELESIVPTQVHATASRRPYNIQVNSDNVSYTEEHITSTFVNRGASVTTGPNGQLTVTPTTTSYAFQTERTVQKTG